MRLHLEILGHFALKKDGEVLDLRGKKAQGLLGRLAMAGPRGIPREALAGLLWGQMPRDRARHNLRQSIAEIRKMVGLDPLCTGGSAVAIDFEKLTVDVADFTEKVCSADVHDKATALASYSGELLVGLALEEEAFDDWLVTERQRLRLLACEAAAAVAQQAMDRSDLDACLGSARRWLELEPACEEAHVVIMEALAKRGDRAGVARQYESCKDALSRHLDLQPSSQTKAVYERLRQDDGSGFPRPTLPLPTKPSLAVLPFQNLSEEEREPYFSDGISEDIIIGLCRFESLFVIARHSSFMYRDANVDVRTVGRELGVHHVVHGSVRRNQDRVRVNVQLSDARTGGTVWAERYDRQISGIFEVQDEITSTVVATLAGRVEAARLSGAKAQTRNLAAYDCLLRGKDHHHRYSAKDNRLSQQWLERALECDPDYATAHAWMACVVAQAYTFTGDGSVFDRAYEHVERARELNDDDSECHRILAAYYLIRKRFTEVELHQERALKLNPNDDRIVCQQGEILGFSGRPEEGVRWVEQAMRLNPYHPDTYWYEYGRVLYGAGRHVQAVQALRRIRNPRSPQLAFLAVAEMGADDGTAAKKTAERLMEVSPHFSGAAFAGGLPFKDPEGATSLAADLSRIGLP